jgi:hypothetical protein
MHIIRSRSHKDELKIDVLASHSVVLFYVTILQPPYHASHFLFWALASLL